MEKLKHVFVGIAVLGICSTVLAQTSGQQSSGGSGPQATTKNSDPFVERREKKTEAKKEYKSGNISKEEYQKEKRQGTQELRASGERGLPNSDLPNVPSSK